MVVRMSLLCKSKFIILHHNDLKLKKKTILRCRENKHISENKCAFSVIHEHWTFCCNQCFVGKFILCWINDISFGV